MQDREAKPVAVGIPRNNQLVDRKTALLRMTAMLGHRQMEGIRVPRGWRIWAFEQPRPPDPGLGCNIIGEGPGILDRPGPHTSQGRPGNPPGLQESQKVVPVLFLFTQGVEQHQFPPLEDASRDNARHRNIGFCKETRERQRIRPEAGHAIRKGFVFEREHREVGHGCCCLRLLCKAVNSGRSRRDSSPTPDPSLPRHIPLPGTCDT